MAEALKVERDFIHQIIAGNESAMLELAEDPQIQQPEMDSTIRQYRHKIKDDRLLLVLKGIRYVSLLNAYFILFRAGFSQEMCILARCMDETLEDATFFSLPHGEGGELSERQKAAMKEFYQEEFIDISAATLKNNGRHRIPRRNIRAAIAAMKENEVNPHDTVEVFSATYDTFSGYVHGAYGHIMELYGGTPARYHTRGTLDDPHYAYFSRELITHVYRGLLITQTVAQKLQRDPVLQTILAMRKSMEHRLPYLAQDAGESIARRKRGKASDS